MADASKTSFLGSISPWSRSSTPTPKSPRQPPAKDEAAKQSPANDHAISLRPTPSLRSYPRDCPALKTRWYYAVDVSKRKPFAVESTQDDKPKPIPIPKKWVSFSASDSAAIESAFQSLDKSDKPGDDVKPTSTKVPVNEDYLYDVHIEKRELEPAYWLGPVYEVRRGSWFYVDGTLCEENLANQIEEGYLKVAPWRRGGTTSRSASQTRSRPSSGIIDAATVAARAVDTDAPISNTYRLFGSHMNSTVTYQDATVAYLSTDDFMSRVGSTIYTTFGARSGTRLVRGYSEAYRIPTKVSDAKDKKQSNKPKTERDTSQERNSKPQSDHPKTTPSRPSALERQLSSLAGLTEASLDEEKLAAEDEQKAQEQEMEDAREKDGEDQGRKIDHLVLVTHGIGQRLGLRLDSINFVHDVNTLRKTMKGVYGTAPDLQALTGDSKNCTIQVLPICWRHMLDFPKQSLKQNRKEFDLGDMDSAMEDEYPSLQDITVDGVPAVRNLITDLAMDVLLYQSAYREHIASIVRKEANRVYKLFKQRTGFEGKVSLCGHSLGSAIIFDILCRQEGIPITRPRRVSSKTSRDIHADHNEVKLEFRCENFFALGSPIALFQMLKGRTIAGRTILQDKNPITSPFNPESVADPFSAGSKQSSTLVPITVSSPNCAELFNIFHPTDPIAYRMEPLISPAMAQLKPQPLPYIKKGLWGAPGIANMTARVGQQMMSSWYSLTSGVASSLINRSLGITGEEQALPQDKPRSNTISSLHSQPTNSSVAAALNAPSPTTASPIPTVDTKKQQELAEAARSTDGPSTAPTLIDSELETLYSGFQKQRIQQQRQHSRNSSNASSVNLNLNPNSVAATTTTATADTSSTIPETMTANIDITDLQETESASIIAQQHRKIAREEAKVRALNSNGRVDYHIQEGMFDVSLLASIASHLSYWADEDVNHFMIGQMLKGDARKHSTTHTSISAGPDMGDVNDGGDLGAMKKS